MIASSRAAYSAYAAFAWSVAFAVPHVYWAAGGTAGLEGKAIDGTLAAINYVAIVLSGAAAALALTLGGRWGRSPPRRVLLTGAWGVCIVLSLRGGAGLIQDLVVLLDGSEDEVSTLVLVFEPLFLVGGILFGLAARQYRRSPEAPTVTVRHGHRPSVPPHERPNTPQRQPAERGQTECVEILASTACKPRRDP